MDISLSYNSLRDRASSLTDKAMANLIGVSSGRTTPFGEGANGASTLANRQVSIDHHREQYRHFTGWIYACIRIIAHRIARQRVLAARHVRKAKRAGNPPRRESLPANLKAYHQELDVLEDHPILDVIHQPNSIMVRWMLLYVTVCSLEITGKCYWWVHDGADEGLPDRKVIWPIPSHWVSPLHQNGRLYDAYRIRPDGTNEKRDVPSSEIVYFYYPDPANPLGALSPLQAAARAVVADEAISEAQRRTFINDLWPGLALIVGRHPDIQSIPGVPAERPTLTKEQRALTVAAVKAAWRGIQNYGEPMILDNFIQDVKRITMNPRELDFMNSGKYTKERITQIFGVNPIVMGEVENVNRASSAAADAHVTENTINPKIELISEILTHQLVPMFDEDPPKGKVRTQRGRSDILIYLEEAHAFDPEQARADREQLLKYGQLSTNENRTENNLPPVHGGDVAVMPTLQLTPIRLIREDSPAPGPEDGPARLPGAVDPPPAAKPPKPPATPPKPPATPPKPAASTETSVIPPLNETGYHF